MKSYGRDLFAITFYEEKKHYLFIYVFRSYTIYCPGEPKIEQEQNIQEINNKQLSCIKTIIVNC